MSTIKYNDDMGLIKQLPTPNSLYWWVKDNLTLKERKLLCDIRPIIYTAFHRNKLLKPFSAYVFEIPLSSFNLLSKKEITKIIKDKHNNLLNEGFIFEWEINGDNLILRVTNHLFVSNEDCPFDADNQDNYFYPKREKQLQ